MTNILYIGAHPTSRLILESEGKINSPYREGEAFIDGFRALKDVNFKVITSPDIASYPQNKPFFKSFYDEEDKTLMVSSLNIDGLKTVWTIASMTIAARKIIRKNEGKTIIFIPYMLFRHVFTASLIKFLSGKKVDVCIIIPDVFFPKKKFPKVLNDISEALARNFAGFIPYTKAMVDHLKISEKPHVVIEGFHKVEVRPIEAPKDKFVITYAGCMEKRFGIGRLLDAFGILKHEDMELHLYGYGDADSLVRERVSIDPRIKYHCYVPKEEAISALFKSSLLINPRNSTDGEYTNFSFPSKDIDYFTTGVPCVLCKLPGMPKEYYGHFIDADNGSAESLASAIEKVYCMTESERKELAHKAQEFIIDRMDTKKQAERILEMITPIITN